jgi:hypothetical protein
MALDDVYTITRPGQANGTGNIDAQHIEEITGHVEGTLERMSVLAPLIPLKPLRGTSIMRNDAVGQSTLQKITPGNPIDGTVNKFGKNVLHVDTTLIARSVFPVLEELQTHYDSRAEVGREHGKTLAKQFDQALFIQAIRAGQLTANTFGLTSAGHLGATQVTLSNGADVSDPALLYQAIVDLLTGMRLKDVDPVMEGVIIGLTPTDFATLSMAELLINSDYITTDGTNVPGMALKAHGVKVVQSNNFVGGQVISGSLMESSYNTYDGDYTKVAAVAFAPKALMAAETIPVTTEVFWDQLSKNWFVDAYRAYSATANVASYAGVILKP